MTAPLDTVIASVNAHRKLRVWSLIITFFGDAIVPRGGAVSARSVQEVMERLGIEAGAVRTAFSRLAGEGWVVREKQGRNAFYRLSPEQQELFDEASARIYAPAISSERRSDEWVIAISENNSSNPAFVKKPDEQLLEKLKDADSLLLDGKILHLPDWFKNRQAPQALADGFRQLMTSFAPMRGADFESLESLAARTLLIHEWRRLLLHHPPVPPEFRPDNWPEDECYEFVRTLYHRLLPGSEEWLARSATGPEERLPGAEGDLAGRFGDGVG